MCMYIFKMFIKNPNKLYNILKLYKKMATNLILEQAKDFVEDWARENDN